MSKNNPFSGFLLKLNLISLSLLIIAILFAWIIPLNFISRLMPYMVAFFYCISIAGYYFLSISLKKRFRLFLNYFMALTFVRLMLMLVIVLLYFFIVKENIFAFAGNFFFLYLIYTVFEVISLLKLNKMNVQ